MLLFALLIAVAQIAIHGCATVPSPNLIVQSPSGLVVRHKFSHPSVTAAAGSDLVIRCSAVDQAVAWSDGDTAILNLDHVGLSDVGLYTCCGKRIRTQCSSIYVFVKNEPQSNSLIVRAA